MIRIIRSSFILFLLTVLLPSGMVYARPPSGPGEVEPWRPIIDYHPNTYQLPRALVDQHKSPDRRYVAQLMIARPGPVIYLLIIDYQLNQRFYLDQRLIIGEQYPYQQMRVYWKNNHTIIIRAKAADGSHYYFILYDMNTGQLTQGKHTVVVKKPRKQLNPEDLKPVQLGTLDQQLQLHKQIPIGVTYAALKQAIPQLGQLEADAGQHLTEAFLQLEVFGHQAEVEFNFKDKVLYNFYYHVRFKDDPKGAEALYKQLQDYYSQHYGQYLEEFVQEERNYAVQNSVWITDDAQASVVNNISHGHNTISWSIKF